MHVQHVQPHRAGFDLPSLAVRRRYRFFQTTQRSLFLFGMKISFKSMHALCSSCPAPCLRRNFPTTPHAMVPPIALDMFATLMQLSI